MEAKAHSLNAGLGTLAIAIGATVVLVCCLLAQFIPPAGRGGNFRELFALFFPI